MIHKKNILTTIQKTLMTARLFDGFWDRWVAHGLVYSEIAGVRAPLKSIAEWEKSFSQIAVKHYEKAIDNEKMGFTLKAEKSYRISGLYYNLVHWIYPDNSNEKIEWLNKSNEIFLKADQLSAIRCTREFISIEGIKCAGRVRVPEDPQGCIIIVNPIDSTKEELYANEKQFIDSGYITVSFDGPGQGETFTLNGLRATRENWELFLNEVIDFTFRSFPGLSIHLFGTSSGAAWAIYGSTNPKIKSAVAVSPPLEDNSSIPNYFGDRINFITKNCDTRIMPNLKETSNYSSILLFHGSKDLMINTREMHQFYEKLHSPKDLVEFTEEGHCCNFKLNEVRDLSMKWFSSIGDDTR